MTVRTVFAAADRETVNTDACQGRTFLRQVDEKIPVGDVALDKASGTVSTPFGLLDSPQLSLIG